MIRRATADEVPNGGRDECLIRIASLKNAYGCDAPFIQFFTDERGGFLSVMDGVGVLYTPRLTDEWQLFLGMNPDIRSLHCPGTVGYALLKTKLWQGRVGDVMEYVGNIQEKSEDICVTPYLPDVYSLLEQHFPGMAPLAYWYPDASHRIRHGCCHIGCVIRDGKVVSTAMTVAETPTEAIIGQVATDPNFRKRGFARKCVESTIAQCKGKSLYILPLHEIAAELYQKLGFAVCGTWAELHKL